MIYLDFAAATPIDPSVIASMHQVQQYFANPGARYASGRQSKELIDNAKSAIAQFLNAKSNEIIITSGSTESNNLALRGVLNRGDHVISFGTEHASILEPLRSLESLGIYCTILSPKSDGIIDVSSLKKSITDNTKLISIALVTSETGVIQPLAKIAKLIDEIKADRRKRDIEVPLLLHTDASAAAWLLPLRVDRLKVDLLTFGGSKLYGPHAIGVLYARREATITPQIRGGHQQNRYRAGTEDIAGVVGLAQAVKLVESKRSQDLIHCLTLRQALLDELSNTFDVFEVHGSEKNFLPSIVNFSLPSLNADTVVSYLDAAGIEVGTGAACSAANREPSHVLLAMGIERESAQASLRISFGRETTVDEVKTFVKQLSAIVAKLDTMKI